MRIAILTEETNSYSSMSLKKTGEDRGHKIDIINTLHCYMNITSSNPTLRYHGEELPFYDAVIPRIRAAINFYGTSVVRQFEMMGAYSINESISISRSRDKLRSLQLLSRKGIAIPRTGFANHPDNIKDLIKNVGGAPLVIKLLEGTQRIGIVLADTAKEAENIIEAFMELKANILIQEFIKESDGADIRCLVVGEKVIAAMKRQSNDGDIRSNIHHWDSTTIIKLSKEEKETAINAAKVMGLNFCGVNLLQSQNGPMVMEVNPSPSIEDIENATQINVADIVFEFMEKKSKHKKQ